MTLQEIRQAVVEGKTVYWSNPAYVVIVDRLGQWFIRCEFNGHCIGLTWQDGKTLNEKPEEFYILEADGGR